MNSLQQNFRGLRCSNFRLHGMPTRNPSCRRGDYCPYAWSCSERARHIHYCSYIIITRILTMNKSFVINTVILMIINGEVLFSINIINIIILIYWFVLIVINKFTSSRKLFSGNSLTVVKHLPGVFEPCAPKAVNSLRIILHLRCWHDCGSLDANKKHDDMSK